MLCELVGLEKAFYEQKVLDPNHVQDALAAHVRSCLARWKMLDVASPYFAMFQSSGYGKSTQLRTLSDRFYQFYISFADEKSTSIPGRSAIVDAFYRVIKDATSEDDAIYRLENFLITCLNFLKSKGFPNCSEFQLLMRMKGSWDEIMTAWKRVNAASERLLDGPVLCTNFDVPVVFAFDEARGMLTDCHGSNAFRMMHRALANIGTRYSAVLVFVGVWSILFSSLTTMDRSIVVCVLSYISCPAHDHVMDCVYQLIRYPNVVAIFTDTFLKISNISPSTSSGPDFSRRHGFQSRKLFPPFINVCTTDVLAKKEAFHHEGSLFDFLKKRDLRAVLTMGR